MDSSSVLATQNAALQVPAGLGDREFCKTRRNASPGTSPGLRLRLSPQCHGAVTARTRRRTPGPGPGPAGRQLRGPEPANFTPAMTGIQVIRMAKPENQVTGILGLGLRGGPGRWPRRRQTVIQRLQLTRSAAVGATVTTVTRACSTGPQMSKSVPMRFSGWPRFRVGLSQQCRPESAQAAATEPPRRGVRILFRRAADGASSAISS